MLLIFSTIIFWLNEFMIGDEHDMRPVLAKVIYYEFRVLTVSAFVKNSNIKAPWMVRLTMEVVFSTIDTVLFWSTVSATESRAMSIVFSFSSGTLRFWRGCTVSLFMSMRSTDNCHDELERVTPTKCVAAKNYNAAELTKQRIIKRF
jgi:hypothetical protein